MIIYYWFFFHFIRSLVISQLRYYSFVLQEIEITKAKLKEFCDKFEQISIHCTFVYHRWEEVEEESGTQLVYNTGGVQLAKKDEMAFVIDQYAKAMSENNIR